MDITKDNKQKTKPRAKKTESAKPAERRQAEVVRTLVKKVEKKLGARTMKPTLGDYIRLVQLQKELEYDEPREIRVTWVETPETKTEVER